MSLAFAAAMALLLIALGAFLFLQVRSSLDEQVNAGLRAQAGTVPRGNLRSGALVEEDESIGQLIGEDGSVIAASPKRLRSALAPPPPDRARPAFESHLSRARWMAEQGYRHLLRTGASRNL